MDHTIVPCQFRIASVNFRTLLCCMVSLPALAGCAVVAVADAAITVGAGVVSIGVTVVETAVDVTAAGVKAVVGTDKPDEKAAK